MKLTKFLENPKNTKIQRLNYCFQSLSKFLLSSIYKGISENQILEDIVSKIESLSFILLPLLEYSFI